MVGLKVACSPPPLHKSAAHWRVTSALSRMASDMCPIRRRVVERGKVTCGGGTREPRGLQVRCGLCMQSCLVQTRKPKVSSQTLFPSPLPPLLSHSRDDTVLGEHSGKDPPEAQEEYTRSHKVNAGRRMSTIYSLLIAEDRPLSLGMGWSNRSHEAEDQAAGQGRPSRSVVYSLQRTHQTLVLSLLPSGSPLARS